MAQSGADLNETYTAINVSQPLKKEISKGERKCRILTDAVMKEIRSIFPEERHRLHPFPGGEGRFLRLPIPGPDRSAGETEGE